MQVSSVLVTSGIRYTFFSLVFLGHTHMGVPRLGVELELQLTAYATVCQIWATSATYITAHDNARSLTHWARPWIEPVSSWILVRFISTEVRQQLQVYVTFALPLSSFLQSLPRSATSANSRVLGFSKLFLNQVQVTSRLIYFFYCVSHGWWFHSFCTSLLSFSQTQLALGPPPYWAQLSKIPQVSFHSAGRQYSGSEYRMWSQTTWTWI